MSRETGDVTERVLLVDLKGLFLHNSTRVFLFFRETGAVDV